MLILLISSELHHKWLLFVYADEVVIEARTQRFDKVICGQLNLVIFFTHHQLFCGPWWRVLVAVWEINLVHTFIIFINHYTLDIIDNIQIIFASFFAMKKVVDES